MKKTYIAPSIKVKEMEATGELLADSNGIILHPEGSLPQGMTESDVANEAWSKKNNCLWDNEEW